MDGHRRPLYVQPSPETYAYQNLYGTVRTNVKTRPSLDAIPFKSKKPFNFFPWKKNNKNKTEDSGFSHDIKGTLSRHNKYKFGSVSALSSGSLYKDWSSLSCTPSVSSTDLKHASVRSVKNRVVTYPWESYNNNDDGSLERLNNLNTHLKTVQLQEYRKTKAPVVKNFPSVSSTDLKHATVGRRVLTDPWGSYNNNHDGSLERLNNLNNQLQEYEKIKAPASKDCSSALCKCQKKMSGPFGTMNSLKPSKCNCGFSSVRSTRGFVPPPPPRRRSILPEKVDLYAVREDQDQNLYPGHKNQVQNLYSVHEDQERKEENIYDTLNRHKKYRAPAPPPTQTQDLMLKHASPSEIKFMKSLEKCKKDPFNSVASRKSILECDVTAYDLVKSYLKGDVSAIDSDLDDDLSDNAIENNDKISPLSSKSSKKNNKKGLNVEKSSYKASSPSPVSSESESGVYSQSVRIGGHGMKLFPHEGNYSDGSKTNSVDSRTSSWSASSLSDDGIYSLPDPDYDEDYQTIQRPSASSSLRYLDKTDSDYQTILRLSPSSSLRKYPSGGYLDKTDQKPVYESPRFSTIRKATSMLSLASGITGESGTLKARLKAPLMPKVPTILPKEPPVPPPPPPPPLPPANFTVKKLPIERDNHMEVQKMKKSFGTDLCGSIATELSERLKSKQPLLRRNEVKPKEAMTVNAHNPYAEVKSILKKTSEKVPTSPVTNSHSSGDISSCHVSKFHDVIKKKRVQFKSLSNESLLVETRTPQSLSSSDEEWEEARDTFHCDTSQLSTSDQSKEEDGEYKTVAEFLAPSKAVDVQCKNNVNKSDGKVPSKAVPRPNHPPPPPPTNPRRANNCRGPRPLMSSPKDPSHTSRGYLRVKKSPPNAISVNTKKDPGNVIKKPVSSTDNPKNGVSSPAASLGGTTPPRGKSSGDQPASSMSDQPVCSNSDQPPCFMGDQPVRSMGDQSTYSKGDQPSYSMGDQPTYSMEDQPTYSMGDQPACSMGDKPACSMGDQTLTEPVKDDTSSAKSSFVSLPSENRPLERPATFEKESRRFIQMKDPAITCTVVSRTNPSTEIEAKGNDVATEPDRQPMSLDLSVEGPLYSHLLYVPQKSPSPPPLPASLPPLPPKRHPSTRLTTSDDVTWFSSDEDSLYDTLPARTLPKGGVYECRRYSDVTVVTIPSGGEPVYSSLGPDDVNDDVVNPFGRHRRSFFEGASKAEILRFLERAKERVVRHLEDDILDDEEDVSLQQKNSRNDPIRVSSISSSSESSTISCNSSASQNGLASDDSSSSKTRSMGSKDVERADSGVGSETSKPSKRSKLNTRDVPRLNISCAEEVCADCDQHLEPSSCCPLVCTNCDKKRSERKEIVTEIVETEFKYGKDLMIIKEEFKTPMEIAALLTKEQLSGVFLNLDELILVNDLFSEKLKDATDIAVEQGDEDLTTVNIGKLFLETSTMLRAFELYCIRQGCASVLLTTLEKEKELLRIFLRVSQMENPLLRRMNLSAFLMVPVQRVTKYPLLLSRLYKVTPYHHKDREALREAQLKIELHLEHINQQTKGITGTKIWRRLSNISAIHRRPANISDIGSIQLRKMAMETLQWSKEDIRFVLAGRLSFTVGPLADLTKSRRGRTIKFAGAHALLATQGKPNAQYRPDLDHEILFPRETGIQDATLLLMKEKNGRYSLAREPLHLGACVISAELEEEDIIEVQEHTTKESVFLKAECKSETLEWLKQLRYHAKDLGIWKRRRNALANIMINGMMRTQ